MENFTYSQDELIADLKRVAGILKSKRVSREKYRELGKFSDRTFYYRFGNWNEAVKRAGLECNSRLRFGEKKSDCARLVKSPTPAEHPLYKRGINKREYISARLRLDVMKRDGFRCVLCGASPAIERGVVLHLDHIVPVCKGGRSTIENLRTLCCVCNWGKSDMTDYNHLRIVSMNF